ncbi:MAG: leucyl aminopeptidase, partial [Pseudomonadota bacterium]
MTTTRSLMFRDVDLDAIATLPGRLAVFVATTGKLDQLGRRVNRLTKGALARFAESTAFGDMAAGDATDMAFPAGLAADALQVVKLDRRPSEADARKAGAAIGAAAGSDPVTVLAGNIRGIDGIALGAVLRNYSFVDHKTGDAGKAQTAPAFEFMVTKPDEAESATAHVAALTEGVFFTRDLVNEPSNVLTTTEFADRLVALKEVGVKVEVLEEKDLEKLGMRTLLAVGMGSETPSKVVVMEWNGGGKEAPFALLGKGVVFDTGGISIKPAGGMELMTMDMGGAGTVAGAMKTLALRKAKANVVGIVGLVENMPDGRAQRPGDVVVSMKGDTVEVINTDAEGRLVLADVMWYAQERFEPTG